MRKAFLAFCILWACVVAVRAEPTAAGLHDALAAAAALCPVSVTAESDTFRLASSLQAATKGQVLTCSHTRSPFLYAIALFQPSGYSPDADLLPTFVVQPDGSADVAQAIKFAAAHNLTLAVKGRGNAWRGTWLADKGLTIDLSAHMNAVSVDPAHQVVHVQGGAAYADIVAAPQAYNLAVPWGDSEQTGMGLALGGGIGYLLRPHGLSADSIISATLVLANGTEVTASASQNADLLAAMRGAGTAFGVVTSLAFKAYDVTDYHGGVLVLTDDVNCTTFRAVHERAAEAMAREPSLAVEVFLVPTAAGEYLVQVQVGMPGSVPKEARHNIISPLQRLPNILQDTLDTLNYTAFEHIVTVLGDQQQYRSIYFVSAVLTFRQAEEGFLDLMPQLLHDVPANVTYMFLADYLGNTVSTNAAKSTSSFTCFGDDIDFHFFLKYEWPAGVDDEANSAFAQERIELIAPYVISTQPYYNLATVINNATLEYQVGGAAKLAELRRLKRQLDPNNLFQRHGLVGL